MKSELKNFIKGLNKKNEKKNIESVGSNYQSSASIGSYSNY